MICKTQMVSHRWGHRRISRLRQPVQTQLNPTGRTPSPLKGISLFLSLSLTHYNTCCFDITFHHASLSSPSTTPVNTHCLSKLTIYNGHEKWTNKKHQKMHKCLCFRSLISTQVAFFYHKKVKHFTKTYIFMF